MPQGYYTIEQWAQSKNVAAFEWITVLQLPFGATLTAAESAIAQLDKPGLFRVVQMQRVVWAEREEGDLKLRKSHAGSPQGLDDIRQMYERSGGRYPVEEVREARKKAIKAKSNE